MYSPVPHCLTARVGRGVHIGVPSALIPCKSPPKHPAGDVPVLLYFQSGNAPGAFLPLLKMGIDPKNRSTMFRLDGRELSGPQNCVLQLQLDCADALGATTPVPRNIRTPKKTTQSVAMDFM